MWGDLAPIDMHQSANFIVNIGLLGARTCTLICQGAILIQLTSLGIGQGAMSVHQLVENKQILEQGVKGENKVVLTRKNHDLG